ncbi:ABC transporter permease subunit [Sinorhizobium meliloti]|uniref:ABC transporter permease subunit n=1 Tax=Rhizobium meliloti TaxID=382 RepID=UPI0001E4B60D|nr:ABC transporter permease subunit [Sinorhizobium meliloti]AEG57887.1 ABC-type transporter, integral membrane subunit [Sinorhizobium meliloti AK83]MDE4587341.1 ABC transporter permease subunit [Sinorhizobium meliloti]SEJ82710.1 ABC-type spermidine/putrescine transport system, permease component I [Sinorhizobium meliloti]
MNSLLLNRWVRGGIIAGPLVILLVGFLFIPLSHIVWGSFEGSKFNFRHYARVLASQMNLNILLRTLEIGLIVTIVSITAGYPVAYLLTKLKSRALSTVSIFILIPLFTAFLIRTYAWMVILGREGIINKTLIWIGLISAPLPLLNTTFAVVLGMAHVFIPMAIFTMYSSMVRIDHEFARAAQTLGATPVQAFLRVYLPLTLPAVFSVGILIFITAIGFYITPALLGGPSDTMISQLIVAQMTILLNFELGYASSIVLLLLTIGILFIASLFVPLEMIWSSSTAAISNEEPNLAARFFRNLKRVLAPLLVITENAVHVATQPLLTPNARWLWTYTVAILIFLTAPLVVVVILSFSSSPFVVFPPPGLSLQWWRKLANATDWHQSFFFSIQLGIAAACVATIIGTMGAFWLVRTKFLFKKMLFLFSLAPLMVPVVIIATSLYVFEARLQILGTFGGLVMGHVLLSVPYVIVVMAAALRNFDASLEPAAAVHGARPLQVLRFVTLPILKPALLTAGLLAFLTSFDELLVGIFLLGRQTPTLPIKFWGDIKYQIDPLLSAASTLIVVLVAASITTVQLVSARHNLRTVASTAE